MCEKLIIQSPLNLNLKDLTDLCLLKEQHWPIGLKKQFGLWFYISNKNDKLIYIEKKQLKIAFLRLKLRRIFIGKQIINSYYLTEVCVDKNYQNKGWGKRIINESQNIIIKDKINAHLLCHREQKEFYLNLGWIYIKQIFTKETLNANIQKVSNEKACLFYNLEYQREKITLIGKIL